VEAYGFGLFLTLHPRFGMLVNHPGGYPGFGSRMVWHHETGIGVIGLANGRYGGPYRDTQRMLLALLDAADAPARTVSVPAPAARLYDDVDRVVEAWDDALLDAIVAANVDDDVPRDVRRREVAEAVATVGGELGPREEVGARTPSGAVWWRRGPFGRVRVEVQLTPQLPQRVQTLDVRAVPDPAPEVRACAARVAASLWAGTGWPEGLARGAAVDVDRLLLDAARARSAGVPPVLEEQPVAGASPLDTTFELRGADMRAQLQVVLDHDVVTSCAVRVLGDPWPTAVRVLP
jgi:hypothetical protein